MGYCKTTSFYICIDEIKKLDSIGDSCVQFSGLRVTSHMVSVKDNLRYFEEIRNDPEVVAAIKDILNDYGYRIILFLNVYQTTNSGIVIKQENLFFSKNPRKIEKIKLDFIYLQLLYNCGLLPSFLISLIEELSNSPISTQLPPSSE